MRRHASLCWLDCLILTADIGYFFPSHFCSRTRMQVSSISRLVTPLTQPPLAAHRSSGAASRLPSHERCTERPRGKGGKRRREEEWETLGQTHGQKRHPSKQPRPLATYYIYILPFEGRRALGGPKTSYPLRPCKTNARA